jgi:hypothetical protein
MDGWSYDKRDRIGGVKRCIWRSDCCSGCWAMFVGGFFLCNDNVL